MEYLDRLKKYPHIYNKRPSWNLDRMQIIIKLTKNVLCFQ